MRSIFARDLPEQLPRIFALLRDIARKESLPDVLQAVLSYIAHSGAAVTTTELKHAVEAALTDLGGESMTTLVEEWLEQGRQEGLHEGREEGQHVGMREAIILSVSERFGETGPDVDTLKAEIGAIEDRGRLRAILRAVVAGQSMEQIRQEIGLRPRGR